MYRFAICTQTASIAKIHHKGIYQSVMLLSYIEKLKGFRCEKQDTVELCLYDGVDQHDIPDLVGWLAVRSRLVIHQITDTTFVS